MIEGNGINKKFGDHVIFDNFDFAIEDGDFVTFSGPSGKGKTTLLNIIGLIEPIDSGSLMIDGKHYKKNGDKLKFYQKKVGFLFQNFALMENKTVRQNLELIKKSNRTEYGIDEVLEIVGLSDKLKSKVYTLSGGEQQRIALARLFLKQCDIILADEPTGSLDSKNAALVMDILRKLNEAGKTLILVTHDENIKKMSNRVIEMYGGYNNPKSSQRYRKTYKNPQKLIRKINMYFCKSVQE
jgi:putative ABC transport system ATP-binding protein